MLHQLPKGLEAHVSLTFGKGHGEGIRSEAGRKDVTAFQ